MKIYNTLGRKLEKFIPIDKNEIKFYHCGPTVYWTQHIGNLRAMVMGDLVRKSLEYLGFKVKYVRNYTDFGHLTSDADEGEDKMEKGAKREGLSPQQIADKYIDIFEKDTSLLKLKQPTVTARATDYINDMIEMVSILLDKGYAYSTPAAIYFDVSKFDKYTELSGRRLDMDKKGAGSGDVVDDNKRNSADFAVWFFKTGPHKNALQYWDSPFYSPEVENGEGFPGWHIECSAMIRSELGDSIDIHMGGVEHISIHHPNEIAQSEAVSGKKFSNYWLHNEHLLFEGGKMSKSLGNVYSVDEIQKKDYDPIHLRYFYLQAHYRSKQNFTWESLDAAKSAYEKIISKVVQLKSESSDSGEVIDKYKTQFIQNIESDFNIPGALAVFWNVLKSDYTSKDKLATVLDFDKIFGLGLDTVGFSELKITDEIQKILNERKQARDNKNWAKSDELRDILKQRYDIDIKDTTEGQVIQ